MNPGDGDGQPSVPGVTHRFVEANGVRLHVAEAGEGEPLVMLHGWPQHWYCWAPVIPALAESHRVICPDLRGFGWSEAPGHGYDTETFARDTIALLDALEIERCCLVGHDWGGFVVFLLALRHPERFRRMIAINTLHPWPVAGNGDGGGRPPLRTVLDGAWRTWYVAMAASPVVGAALARNRRVIAGVLRGDNVHEEAFTDADVEWFASRLRSPERAHASQSLYRHYLRRAVATLREPETRRLTVPTRMLFGARDLAISKRLLRGFEARADDMELEFVADSGHFLPAERPDLVIDRARAFFAPA